VLNWFADDLKKLAEFIFKVKQLGLPGTGPLFSHFSMMMEAVGFFEVPVSPNQPITTQCHHTGM
jgi:hypothetical protein